MSYRAVAYLSLEAIKHNLSIVHQSAPQASVLPMIKGNAYGHGIEACLPAFENEQALGVASIDEAELLRNLGWQKRIVVTSSCFTADEYQWCALHRVSPVLYSLDCVERLKATPLPMPLHVWVEFDSGMHRSGMSPSEVERAEVLLSKMNEVIVDCWLSHFSAAHLHDTKQSERQWAQFNQYALPHKSMANSAGILSMPNSQADWVRPGLMLYGLSPFPDKTGVDLGLKPVMCLQARLLSKRTLVAGDAVGYAGLWAAPLSGATVGTVSIGYADGYPWMKDATGVSAALNGQPVTLIGQVSMDSMTIDLSSCPDVPVGSLVTLWGPELPAEKIAFETNRIAYSLVTNISARVKRQVLERLPCNEQCS